MDSIRIYFESYEDSSVNFLQRLDGRLSDQKVTQRGRFLYMNGRLRNLRIMATEKTLKIEGSFTKFYFGNNIQEIDIDKIKTVVNVLSKFFGVDISTGKVTKLHYGINVKLPYPSNLIFKRLGYLKYMDRFEQKHSLYYQNQSKKLVIYDKTKESKKKSQNGDNITRIELRFEKNIGYYFQGGLTVADLCELGTMMRLECELKELFNSINLIKQDVSLKPTIKPANLSNQLASMGVKMIGYHKICDQVYEWNELGLIPHNKHYRNLEKLKELQGFKFGESDDPVLHLLIQRVNFKRNLSQL